MVDATRSSVPGRELAALARLGYEESRLLDLTFQQITHPDDLEADLDQVQRVLSGELGAYKLEKRYVVEDGRVIWAMLSVSLVRDNDGTPLYFVSQIEDITDRKAAPLAVDHHLRTRRRGDGLDRRRDARRARPDD
jgi:PAS domain S-box-containing protein